MKRGLAVCVALATLALAAGGTPAAAAGFVIGTEPGTTEADCIKAGGTVTVDDQGRKFCVPKPVKTTAPAPGREPPN